MGGIDDQWKQIEKLASLTGDLAKPALEAAKAMGYLGDAAVQEAQKLQKEAENLRNGTLIESQAGQNDDYSKKIEKALAQAKSFANGLDDAFISINEKRYNFAYQMGTEIPQMFSDGMSNAMMSLLEGASSFKEILRSAAYEFMKQINSRIFGNIADSIVGGFGNMIGGGSWFTSSNKRPAEGKAAGGMITGGSGMKDDVPALLMGGEYVIKKDSVNKYGREFFEMLNSGAVPKFSKGGFFAPGMYDQGPISGKGNLLSFATQAATSGERDFISSTEDGGVISLEPESARLTTKGRKMGTPLQRANEEAKRQAFDLYVQQVKAEEEAARQAKEQKEQFRRQMLLTVGSLAVAGIAKVGLEGFNTGFSDVAAAAKANGTNAGYMEKLAGGFSGVGKSYGNLFGGIKDSVTGNLSSGFNSINTAFSQGYARPALSVGPSQFSSNLVSPSIDFTPAVDGYGRAPTQAELTDGGVLYSRSNYPDEIITLGSPLPRATGGRIPSSTGIDTIPAMLSGGEFVMNAASTKNIGEGNLNALNSGSSSLLTEDKSEELNNKLISKIDELIEASGSTGAINITVNTTNGKESTEGEDSPESGRNLSRKIKDAVLRVIEEEKRLGGTLRRGLA
jgi:hypothetical protein